MKKWSQMDGLGALIISPTRELAYQTFEVLRKVGKHHDFSAGLVIGGKVNKYTIKPVLSGHLKRSPKLFFKTNYRLMQVKSIAECSPWRAFCSISNLR